jgi:hypothetical protein
MGVVGGILIGALWTARSAALIVWSRRQKP